VVKEFIDKLVKLAAAVDEVVAGYFAAHLVLGPKVRTTARAED
jgi:hypothetical protein